MESSVQPFAGSGTPSSHHGPLLSTDDQQTIFRHARKHFTDLVTGGATGFDDLAFLDKPRARPWYGRTVELARTFASTGTSGHPKPIPWTAEEDAWYVGEKESLFAAWLQGCRRAFVSLAVGHNANSALLLLQRLGMHVHDAGLSPLSDQADVIADLEPEVLYCSPSILANLIVSLRRKSTRPTTVRRIITNGEVLFPSARRTAQDFFGLGPADVMDTYGSTEIGTIAHSCPTCGAYHFLDGLYPEPVPAEMLDQGIAAEETVLAVSSVKRTSFPVVRFVTYDVIRGLRRTVCRGATRFSFERIVGRCDDVLNYGELFSAYDLGDLIGHHLPGARWYAFNGHNDLTVVIEGSEPPGFRDALRERFPVHRQMIDLGLIQPPVLHFVDDFDDFAARAELPAARHGKAGRRVRRQAAQPGWFDGQLR